MHPFMLDVKMKLAASRLRPPSGSGDGPQLRRRDRPAETAGTRFRLAVELEQTCGPFFQIDARILDVRHQPCRQNTQVWLMPDGCDDVRIRMTLEPFDE